MARKLNHLSETISTKAEHCKIRQGRICRRLQSWEVIWAPTDLPWFECVPWKLMYLDFFSGHLVVTSEHISFTWQAWNTWQILALAVFSGYRHTTLSCLKRPEHPDITPGNANMFTVWLPWGSITLFQAGSSWVSVYSRCSVLTVSWGAVTYRKFFMVRRRMEPSIRPSSPVLSGWWPVGIFATLLLEVGLLLAWLIRRFLPGSAMVAKTVAC